MEKDSIDRLLRQGEMLFASGNMEDAEKCFKDILDLQLRHTDALNNIGVIAFMRSDFKIAMDYFRRVLEIDKHHTEAIENYSKSLIAVGDHLGAVNFIRKSFDHGIINSELLNMMGKCFLELNDLNTAKVVFEKSLLIDPDQADREAINASLIRLTSTETNEPLKSGEIEKGKYIDDQEVKFVPDISAVTTHTGSRGQQGQGLKAKLNRLKDKTNFKIKIVSFSDTETDSERRLRWGDYWVKHELEKELRSLGHIITDEDPDVIFHMFGAPLRFVPTDTYNIIWIHSHPDWITPEILKHYDHIFCLSPKFIQNILSWHFDAELLIGATSKKPVKTDIKYDIVFVANTKGRSGRKIVNDLGDLTKFPYKLKIWGEGWEGIIPGKFYGGKYYRNEDLGELYASSLICLNDHHEDMRKNGFINPRIFDILAAGGFCISDGIVGLEDILEDAVPRYRTPEELRTLIDYYISNPHERDRLAQKGQQIASSYSFQEMARHLIESVGSKTGSKKAEEIPIAVSSKHIKLDLGCGSQKREGFIGLDMKALPGVDIVCDVTKGIPLSDNSVECLIANNLMEHIGDEFISVMNDIWRICTPDALIKIIVPGVHTNAAFQDPTHKRFFVQETFDYFNADHERWKLYGSSYGIKPFKFRSLGLRKTDRRFIEAEMTPVKDMGVSVQASIEIKRQHKTNAQKTDNEKPGIKNVLMSFGFVPHSTAAYLIRALKKKGVTVRSCGPLDKATLLKTWTNEQLTRLVPLHDVITDRDTSIIEVIDSFKDGWTPDLFLWVESSMSFPNFPSSIDKLRCPSAAYFIDSHTKLNWHIQFAPKFSHVFVAQKAYIPAFERAGCKLVSWLPLACDPEIHGKRNTQKTCDISFVGHLYPGSALYQKRNEILSALQERFNVKIEQKYFEEMAESFSRAHLIFNISAKNDLNMRVFEALASGSLLITDRAPGSGLTDLFNDGEDLVVYDDMRSLIELAGHYLKNTKEAEEIALSGMRKVLAHHTYENRAEEIFSTIKLTAQPLDQTEMQQKNRKSDTNISPSISNATTYDTGLRIEEYPSTNSRNGNLRIFAAFAHFNWEDHNLQPALEEFGQVVRLRWPPYNQYEDDWHFSKKQWFNIRLLEAVKKVHDENKIDVFFGYLSGRVIFPSTIRTINLMGIPTLNLCLDDKTKFLSRLEPTGYAGMIDIASAFILCWTSTEDAVKNYEAVGAKAIYLPEGANPKVYKRLDLPFDIDVSFVGQCYGQRPKVIEHLRGKGINVQTFGKGWPSGELSVEEMVRIYNRSRINLGFSMVGDFNDVFCLKGRDFEIPMAGGLYFTQFHPELCNVYDIGKEIVCYDDLDDLVAKISYYLEHPDEAEKIRTAGYKRAQREHTWVQRFRHAFEAMGLIKQ